MGNRMLRAIALVCGALMVACSFPTDACGCTPSRSAVILRGQLQDRSGAPVADVRLAADGIPSRNATLDTVSVWDEHTVRTNADGTFRLTVYSLFSADTLKLRVALMPSGTRTAAPFAVILARFRPEGTLSDSIARVFVLP